MIRTARYSLRRTRNYLITVALCSAILITAHTLAADVSAIGDGAASTPEEPPQREIFIPFDDLKVILSADVQRVFVTREEYETLAAKAKRAAKPEGSEQPAAVLSADYVATIEENRARLMGTLVVTAPDDAVNAVQLDLSGVALRRATLDGKPAPLGHGPAGSPELFVSGAGRHELKLEILAPLETAAAQRTLSFHIPTPPATRIKLTVPGNVEIKSGATIIRREVDQRPATTFDLLPRRGLNSLVLSLNNHQLRKESVVVAHSVTLDEITSAYERLHVTETLSVLHGAAEQFRFVLPDGFEVTSVSGAQVARWAITAENGRRILEVHPREPITDMATFNISAIRTPAVLAAWRLPKLTALEVAGQAGVVGLFVESRLKPYGLQPQNLISIDTGVLTQKLPAGLTAREAGAPVVSPVAAFYAPRGDYDLKAHFAPPPNELLVTSNVLLTLTESKLEAKGGFALANVTDKLLGFDFSAPAGWQVTELKLDGGVPLAQETYPADQGGTRIHVRLPHATPQGRARNVYFHAVSTPEGWLDDWSEKRVEFPVFQVAGATSDSGALAVQSQDDMRARADQVTRLTPLDANEKSKFGLENVTTELAYRYEEPPYTLILAVARVQPRLTARAFSFFRVEPDLLTAHYELAYDVTEARTGRLQFALPESTPAELAIHGLDGLTIKESSSVVKGHQRQWTVWIGESRRGAVRLAIDFQQPLGDRRKQPSAKEKDQPAPSPAELALPLVNALHVAYQTGLVSVEGSSEAEVQVTTALRKVDVGRLAEADYQPGRRLLGAFGYGGDEAEVKVAIARPAGYELPTAIVERAELLTMISAHGRSQTAARFQLRCKAQLIDVELPTGSTLWSAYLDGKPTQPQREGNSLLIELPAAAEALRRDFQLVYETPINALGLASSLELAAPKLRLRTKGSAAGEEVPLADLVWQLSTPNGLKIVRSNGTVFSWDVVARESPLPHVTDAVSEAISVTVAPFAGVQSAREAAYRSPSSPVNTSTSMAEMPKTAATPPSKTDSGLVGLSPGAKSAAREEQFGAADPSGQSSGKFRNPDSIPGETRANVKSTDSVLAARSPPVQPSPNFAESAIDEPTQRKTADAKQSLWALEGVRSLPIELQPDQIQTTFQSLGEEPRLSVVAVDRERFELLGWCVGLVVFLWGVTLTRATCRRRFKFVAVTLSLSFALPLVVPWTGVISPLCNMAFYAACWLILYYLAASVVRRIVGFARSASSLSASKRAALASIGLLLLLNRAANAEDPLVPLVVPADAIIVPYDPAKQDPLRGIDTPSSDKKPNGKKNQGETFGPDKSQKLLVPYQKYLELQRAANADGVAKPAAPAEYALAGWKFSARLDGGGSLLIEGRLDMDVLVDHLVSIPLALGAGVLTSVEVDGKPGAVKIREPDQANREPASKDLAAALPATESPLTLLISGTGRRRVDLAIRFQIERRGGWQIVAGRLPTLPAAALTLEVPKAGTEIILSGGVERGTFETKHDKETIETALTADGTFRLQWRAKTAQAPVDQSLAVRDTAQFDVEEGGLRLAWRFDLEFRRGQRESFTIDIPDGYLVEKVTGSNVRGWNLKEAGALRKLDVTLLKAAQDNESFSVALSRGGAVGSGALPAFAAPVLSVEGASQQSGELTIRSSPRLELRAENVRGASRADGNGSAPVASADGDDSPLGIVPFQVYRFATTPFTIQLSARPVAPHASAELQTVLRISELQRTMESRIRMHVDGQPIYRLRIALPDDLRLDRVNAPEPFQWVVDQEGQRRLLSLYFAAGQRRQFDIVLAGTLGKYEAAKTVAVPKLDVADVDEHAGSIEQSGDIAVEADPSLEIQADKLAHCEPELIEHVNAWLEAGQQHLARLALRYRTPAYSAELRLSPRKPLVHCDTFTNIRVNERTVQETILLDFKISEAGIRSLSFLLPESMRDARISAPKLRQKTVEPVGDGATARIRVKIELQEEVMGSLRVLVENDRLLSSEKYVAPRPVVETGLTDHSYITLESAGRDEIVVDAHEGVDQINREQAEWRMLTGILGRGLTQAYLVRSGAAQPLLTLHAKDRAAVETAGARIGLARATLIVDANGAYRGAQLYRVDNSLEQYLEIQLPVGARLWTAHVAGEPVKPAAGKPSKAPATGGDIVRIPLIKTARGDADYEVVLKYGGQLGRLKALDHVEFPLIHSVNIHVEFSQVELNVPETHDWFDFGGTMGQVREGDLAAGWLAYNSRQIGLAMQAWQNGDAFAKTRAANNLKALQAESESLKQTAQEYGDNSEVRQQLQTNSAVQAGLNAASLTPEAEEQSSGETDNRAKLGGFYQSQSNTRANDIVNSVDTNFGNNVTFQQGSFTGKERNFAAAKLASQGEAAQGAAKDAGDKKGQGVGAGVNTDAGLVGDVSIDEANSAATVSLRGAGQRLKKPDAPILSDSLPTDAPPALATEFGSRQAALNPGPNSFNRLNSETKTKPVESSDQAQSNQQGSGQNSETELQRYSRRLANKGQQRGPASYVANGGGMPQGAGGPDGFNDREEKNPIARYDVIAGRPEPGKPQNGDPQSRNAQTDTPASPIALASLEVELHPRGVKYLFTTPRGDAEITARAISDSLLGRLLRLAGLAATILFLWIVIVAVRRWRARVLCLPTEARSNSSRARSNRQSSGT